MVVKHSDKYLKKLRNRQKVHDKKKQPKAVQPQVRKEIEGKGGNKMLGSYHKDAYEQKVRIKRFLSRTEREKADDLAAAMFTQLGTGELKVTENFDLVNQSGQIVE